jgi:hypothetical protein
MPKRGRFEVVYLCAGLYVTNGRSDRQFSIVIRIGSAPITYAAAGGLMVVRTAFWRGAAMGTSAGVRGASIAQSARKAGPADARARRLGTW